MARNAIERAVQRFLMQAAKMSKGITTTGASVPVTMVTQAAFDAARTTYTSSEDDFGVKRQALKDARDTYAPAGSAVYDFLNAARPVFVSNFGYQWSANWAAAGWITPSTAIPTSQDVRIQLVASIATFLAANPDYEVAKTGVTAANAVNVHDNAFALLNDVTGAERDLNLADATRTSAHTALVGQMQLLIKNLSKLPKDDPRWKMFGLNMPASKTTPDKPTGLTAHIDATTGKMIMSCDAQPLGERFRFRGRIAGSGGPFTLLASAPQPMAAAKPYPPGTEVELIVQAVNGGAQSVPSDSIFFTVPTVSTTGDALVEPAAKLTATKPAAVASNGHGNGNGTAKNGRRSISRVS